MKEENAVVPTLDEKAKNYEHHPPVEWVDGGEEGIVNFMDLMAGERLDIVNTKGAISFRKDIVHPYRTESREGLAVVSTLKFQGCSQALLIEVLNQAGHSMQRGKCYFVPEFKGISQPADLLFSSEVWNRKEQEAFSRLTPPEHGAIFTSHNLSDIQILLPVTVIIAITSESSDQIRIQRRKISSCILLLLDEQPYVITEADWVNRCYRSGAPGDGDFLGRQIFLFNADNRDWLKGYAVQGAEGVVKALDDLWSDETHTHLMCDRLSIMRATKKPETTVAGAAHKHTCKVCLHGFDILNHWKEHESKCGRPVPQLEALVRLAKYTPDTDRGQYALKSHPWILDAKDDDGNPYFTAEDKIRISPYYEQQAPPKNESQGEGQEMEIAEAGGERGGEGGGEGEGK